MSSLLKYLVLCFAFLSVQLSALAQETGASASVPMSMSSPSAGDTAENTLLPERSRMMDVDLKKVYPDPRYPHWVMPRYPEPGCVRVDTLRGFAEASGADPAGAVYALLSLGMMLVMAWTIFKEHVAKNAGGRAVRRVWKPGVVWLFILVLIYSGAMFWYMSPGFIVLPFVVFMAQLAPEDTAALPPRGFELFCQESLKNVFLWLGLGSLALMCMPGVEYDKALLVGSGEEMVHERKTLISFWGLLLGSCILLTFYFIFPLVILLYAFAKFQRNYLRSERTED